MRLLNQSGVFCMFGNTKDLVNSFGTSILIVAAVESDALLFVSGSKFELKKNQPI